MIKKQNDTDLVNRIRYSKKYFEWRHSVLNSNWNECQKCGIRGDCLQVHHKKTILNIIRENKIKNLKEALLCDELWNINNGEIVCELCHQTHHLKKLRIC